MRSWYSCGWDWGLVGIASVMLVSACSAAPSPNGHSGVTPSVAVQGAQPSVVAMTAREAAQEWMIRYWTRDWRDRSPAAWVDRVRPYVSDAQHARDEELREGTIGIDWAEFVEHRCHSEVDDVTATVPPEAPGTPDLVNVQVTARIHTGCAEGGTRSAEYMAATLVVTRSSDGTFRVDQRVF